MFRYWLNLGVDWSPLQTIFLNLFTSATIFFSKRTFLPTIFFLPFFLYSVISLVLNIFQLFFEKKKSLIL